MKALFRLGSVALLLGFLASSVFAGNISILNPTCVTNNSSGGWVLTGPNGGSCGVSGPSRNSADPLLPATFVFPEAGSDTAPEAVGDFTFNKVFNLPNIYFTMQDPTGGISDYLLFGNTFGGFAEIFFYSDPAVPTSQILSQYTFAGLSCIEDPSAGCVATSSPFSFTDGTSVVVTVGSDGNSGTFDPFNSGMNTSDGIRFTDGAPEPATWMMIGSGLLVAFLARRRRSV